MGDAIEAAWMMNWNVPKSFGRGRVTSCRTTERFGSDSQRGQPLGYASREVVVHDDFDVLLRTVENDSSAEPPERNSNPETRPRR